MTFVAINTLEQNIVMTAANNTTELLEQLGPARINMALVEPVAVPILLEAPNMALQPIQTHIEFDNMDMDDTIIDHPINDLTQPMMDVDISIEAKELEYSEEANIDWIDEKI